MIDADAALLIEIALRDARHMNVIMAMDRLNIMPTTESALKQAMADLATVKEFFNTNLPPKLRAAASEMFIEHGRKIERHFRAKQFL